MTYHSVNTIRVTQSVQDLIRPGKNIPEIKLKTKFGEFLFRHGALPIHKSFPSGILDDTDHLGSFENFFFIIEDKTSE